MDPFFKALTVLYFIVVILGIILGFGDNRKIVVFNDYDDLGLTFLIPVSYFLIIYLGAEFGISFEILRIIALIVVIFILGKLFMNTYKANNGRVIHTLLAFVTKIPIGVIFVFHLLEFINPSGKTYKQKRENRERSLAILVLLTPIIAGLVVNKEGKFFKPKEMIKNKRVGSIRDYL